MPEPRTARGAENPFGARPEPLAPERYGESDLPRRSRAAQPAVDLPAQPIDPLVDPLDGTETGRSGTRGPLDLGSLPASLASVARPEGAHAYGEPLAPPADLGPYAADPLRSQDAPTGPVPRIAPPEDEPGYPGPGTRHHSQPLDRSALRRPAGPTEPVGDGVYRTRRPAVALIFAVLTVLLEAVAVRLLVDAVVGGPVLVGGAVAGTFLALGLPPFAAGLYAFVTTGRAVEPRALLRPPVGYLTVGLVLFLAAGLAAA